MLKLLTKTPVSLSSIQCFGAATRFRCFFGPLAWRRDDKAGHELNKKPVTTACVSGVNSVRIPAEESVCSGLNAN